MPTAIQPASSEQPSQHPTVASTLQSTFHSTLQSTSMPLVKFLVPDLTRPFTKDEQAALRSFIAILPVSPQLDHGGLSVLHGFVAPFYVCSQPETIVAAETIQHCVNERAERIGCQFSLADVHQVVGRIFATTNTLTIGQLQVERDAVTNSLVLRLNADNHNALLDFIIMLVGEEAV